MSSSSPPILVLNLLCSAVPRSQPSRRTRAAPHSVRRIGHEAKRHFHRLVSSPKLVFARDSNTSRPSCSAFSSWLSRSQSLWHLYCSIVPDDVTGSPLLWPPTSAPLFSEHEVVNALEILANPSWGSLVPNLPCVCLAVVNCRELASSRRTCGCSSVALSSLFEFCRYRSSA